jgi:hypothetical protein
MIRLSDGLQVLPWPQISAMIMKKLGGAAYIVWL